MESESKEFTGLRAVLWPIHSFELRKFLPMAIMMMGILFNYIHRKKLEMRNLHLKLY